MPFFHCTVISCKRRSFGSLACMEGASNRFYWLGDQLKHLALIQNDMNLHGTTWYHWLLCLRYGCTWLNDEQICFMLFMTVRVLNSTGPTKAILGGGFRYLLYFHPYLGKIPILTNIFQRGWNHQPLLLTEFGGVFLQCVDWNFESRENFNFCHRAFYSYYIAASKLNMSQKKGPSQKEMSSSNHPCFSGLC